MLWSVASYFTNTNTLDVLSSLAEPQQKSVLTSDDPIGKPWTCNTSVDDGSFGKPSSVITLLFLS